MNNPERYTITAALPYANGPLHIGHLAGVYVPADIYVRYLRFQKRDVLFVCGSDEHGAAITLRAKKEGVTPQEIVDKYHLINKKAFEDFGIEFDIFHRTSTELHHKTAQEFFTKLNKQGSFDVKTTQQFYDEEQQQFLADRYIMGTCPVCGNENAYGDQCESCGSSLNSQDLKNRRSVISGNTPVLKDTTLWYLPMENHEEWLKKWINEGVLDGKQQHNPAEWKKQVLGQCRSWIEGGLQSRAMTRDLDWGVPVPLENAEGKVLYVWLDAPIGYISASKQWAIDNNKNWEPYWKNSDTKLVHFLAKDNIVFHCIIFPIILKEHGDFILPDNVPANEFLNLEGNKISTSRNWAVWLHEYLEDFGGKQDELRYVLNAISPEFRDSEFTWADYQARVNNELVAVLGNFVNRTLVLTQKYYEGAAPERGALNEEDQSVLKQIEEIPERIAGFIEKYRFRDAQQEAMQLGRAGNKYLAETEPWKLIKTDPERVKTILNICLQLCANITIVFEPFLPETCAKLREMLNFSSRNWSDAGSVDLINANHQIGKPALLFERIEDSMVEKQVAKLKASKKVETVKAHKPLLPEVNFEDFTKMDIRVGQIIEAEKVPKTSKLLKLLVDTGVDKRTVVSGIAEFYNPKDIIGKKVSLLLNLQPRKIKGIESQGMILMAENSEGKLSFVSPAEGFENGSEIS